MEIKHNQKDGSGAKNRRNFKTKGINEVNAKKSIMRSENLKERALREKAVLNCSERLL